MTDKNKNKSKTNHSESGNVLFMILVGIVLFAALNFTISRFGGGEDASEQMKDDRVELSANQIAGYAMQAKNVIERLEVSGTDTGSLTFEQPSDPDYDTPPNTNKLFHPQGGGMNAIELSNDVYDTALSDPAPGIYYGRFENIEWTPSTAHDVVMTVYGLKQSVCEKLNNKIIGSATIPDLDDTARNLLVDDEDHNGTNLAFAASECPACDGYPLLCVKGSDNVYAFYNILVGR